MESFNERYNRQLILKGFGSAAQQKLSGAKLLVVGAGGLGCPALHYLAAAGIGTIGIVDDDTVSLSNLHRQILFTTNDVGHSKAEVAKQKLLLLNPETIIISYPFQLTQFNAFEIIEHYDCVIDGTDNFSTRYIINDACVLLGKPLVYGAVSQYEGQVAVFNVQKKGTYTANYRDLFPEPPGVDEIANCSEAGVLGPLPGIIGTMQAIEAIKLVTGVGELLANKLLTYNMLLQQFYDVLIEPVKHGQLPKSKEEFLLKDYALTCRKNARSIEEISGHEIRSLSGKPSTIVIDVRESYEQPKLKGIDHLQIPMAELEKALPHIAAQNVIFVCQHGVRSLYAAELLQEMYGTTKNGFSVKGGVAKWGAELFLPVQFNHS